MRIHSDTLTTQDFTTALRAAGLNDVRIDGCTIHGSHSRRRAYEVRLEAEPKQGRRRRNTGTHGAEDAWQTMMVAAATYDEHGYWMVELFGRDPKAIVGPYDGRDDFHRQTDRKFDRTRDQSKFTDEHGVLRYSVDHGAVFPGPTGMSWSDKPTPIAR